MFKYKKAIVPVVVIVLLLMVGVVSYIYLQEWFISYKSDVEVKINSKDIHKTLKVVKIEGTGMLLNNQFIDDIIISSIKINGEECINKNFQIDMGLATIDIGGCTAGLTQAVPYNVALISDYGIVNSVETIRMPVAGPLVANFVLSSNCLSLGGDYIRLYGLTGLENAHADIDATSTYSLCVRSLDYPIATSGYINTKNFIYLTSTNNSAVYTDQGSIYSAPSFWYNIGISSDAAIDFRVNTTDMTSSGYVCIGKIDEDNVYGSHIGDCSSSHPDILWLKIGP